MNANAVSLKRIIDSALRGIDGLTREFIIRLQKEVAEKGTLYWQPSRIAALMRERLEAFEPLLAKHLSDTTLASWIMGYDAVAKRFPQWLEDEFQKAIRNLDETPIAIEEPPKIKFWEVFAKEPTLQLPTIEYAANSLINRNILTREEFDNADASAKRNAFTIAGNLKTDAITDIRNFLVDDLHSGTSLTGFEKRVEEHFGGSVLAPHHLENVYRTNVQAALRDGKEALASKPIVRDVFPYQEYIPIHDARARHTHTQLGVLGLSGTGIYRRDDPMWDEFSPPWEYNCRCGTRLLTVEGAARSGVREAQEWLRTGFPPLNPEYRLEHIPFRPEPGWGHRGNDNGVITMGLTLCHS